VRVGETFGLLGPNGTGKTTALSILATRLQHVTGEVSVLGRRLPEQVGVLRREVGLAPQELSFYPGLTGLENLHSSGASMACGAPTSTSVARRHSNVWGSAGAVTIAPRSIPVGFSGA